MKFFTLFTLLAAVTMANANPVPQPGGNKPGWGDSCNPWSFYPCKGKKRISFIYSFHFAFPNRSFSFYFKNQKN